VLIIQEWLVYQVLEQDFAVGIGPSTIVPEINDQVLGIFIFQFLENVFQESGIRNLGILVRPYAKSSDGQEGDTLPLIQLNGRIFLCSFWIALIKNAVKVFGLNTLGCDFFCIFCPPFSLGYFEGVGSTEDKVKEFAEKSSPFKASVFRGLNVGIMGNKRKHLLNNEG
jgi:hypothetical protein